MRKRDFAIRLVGIFGDHPYATREKPVIVFKFFPPRNEEAAEIFGAFTVRRPQDGLTTGDIEAVWGSYRI